MCLICIEWEKGKMTKEEVLFALREFISIPDISTEELRHYIDLAEKAEEKDKPETD